MDLAGNTCGGVVTHTFVFVDDEPMIGKALARLVRNEPFAFYWFHSPIQALEQIEAIAPQVILSDQRMPHMTGIQFLRSVRDKLPDSFRMILTGYCMPEHAESALEKGDVSKFISKPWDNLTLLEEIRSAFHFSDSTRAPGIVWCDICGARCSATTIQIHHSYHLCTQCKRKAEPLPEEAIRNVVRFFSDTS